MSPIQNRWFVIEDVHSGIKAAHQANIGKIVALGPQEKHDALMHLEGVSEVIVSLEKFPRESQLAGSNIT